MQLKQPILGISTAMLAVCLQSAHGFQQIPLQKLTCQGSRVVAWASEREDILPETSFGAEVVPEGQRPVNEYMEMRRSPLFEWASNDIGTKGVRSQCSCFPSFFLRKTRTSPNVIVVVDPSCSGVWCYICSHVSHPVSWWTDGAARSVLWCQR